MVTTVRYGAGRAALSILLLALTSSAFAGAESGGPAPVGTAVDSKPDGVATPREASALAVDIEEGAGGFEADALREAIAREASVRVTGVDGVAGPRLFVRRRGPSGLELELVDKGRHVRRTIELPDDGSNRRLTTAALVVVSLLEDEAATLLERLRAEARAAAPPPPPPPPASVPAVVSPPPLRLGPCTAPAPEHTRAIGADVAPRVGTSSVEPPGTVRHISIELAGGRMAGVRGFELGALLGLGGEFVCGAQVAGLVGWAGRFSGAQISGLVSATTHASGFQIGGLGSYAAVVDGIQVGGLAALGTKNVRGAQIAAVTYSPDLAGAQVGVVNVASKVRGLQLGFVNVASESDASVGAVSIVTHGRTNIDAFMGTDGVIGAALLHGSRYVHNYYGAVVSPLGKESVASGPMIGIGFHAFQNSRFFVDIDALGAVLFTQSNPREPQTLWQVRAVLGLRLTPGAALYAGWTYDVLRVPTGQAPNVAIASDVAQVTSTGGGQLHLFPGLVGGVRGL